MSTIEHTEAPSLVGVPIARRITEVLAERGEAYSIRAFSARIGRNRETLRLMLNGERRISPADLEMIANGLGVTVERLKQEDTRSKEQELVTLLSSAKRTKVMLTRANKLANELVEVAIGATEKGYCLFHLGRVQFLHEQYDAAHHTWKQSLELAKQVHEGYGDSELLHLVTSNLMITHTLRKEYSDMEDMLLRVENVFNDNPTALGNAYYARMKMQEGRGNLVLAKKHAYRSLEHFEQTNDKKKMGRALINVAHYEFFLGNYKTSVRALLSAIKMLEHFEDILIIAVKEYIKSLIKMKEYQNAIQVIEKYLPLAKEFPTYYGRLMIMYTMVKGDPQYADNVINDSTQSSDVRFYACKCLLEFYTLNGDAQSAISYYEKERIFSGTKSEFLEEEEF